jgi:DNA replication initiation complex subunit (GINS family)
LPKELRITYETLFELLMREKGREELQKLETDHLESVRAYIAEKKRIAEASPGKLDYFTIQERDKTEKQLQNIYRILRELYDRREKKVLNLALVKSRTGSDMLDTSGMQEKEELLFTEMVTLLDRYRKELLLDSMNVSSSDYPAEAEKPEVKSVVEEPKLQENQKELSPEEEEEEKLVQQAADLAKDEAMLIRFLYAVPKFVDKNMEVYGPFEEEDIASLPSEIADLLIKKGRAEKIGAA